MCAAAGRQVHSVSKKEYDMDRVLDNKLEELDLTALEAVSGGTVTNTMNKATSAAIFLCKACHQPLFYDGYKRIPGEGAHSDLFHCQNRNCSEYNQVKTGADVY
jgi:hypothetical protein